MKQCSYCGRENDPAAYICQECGTLLSEDPAPVPVEPVRQPRCPSCGETSAHERVAIFVRPWSLVVFLLTGLFGAMLWRSGKKARLRCGGCGGLFYSHITSTKLSLYLAWCLIAFKVLAVLMIVLSP